MQGADGSGFLYRFSVKRGMCDDEGTVDRHGVACKFENGKWCGTEIASFGSPTAAAECYQRTQVAVDPANEGDILEVRLEFDDGENRILQRYKDCTGELN